MKAHFSQLSTLNGSLNGYRYLFAGGEAPKGPEQQVEKPKEGDKKVPENSESAVRETKVEGRKTVTKAKREVMRMEPINFEGKVQKQKQVMRITEAEAGVIKGKVQKPKQTMQMDELAIKPRTPQEIAHGEKLAKSVEKAAPWLKDLQKDVVAMTETAPNEEQMGELATQIKEEFSKNPDLAAQMTTQLRRIDAAHANPEDLKIILEKVDGIFANFSVDQNPRQTRNEINRLGVDVHHMIAQRDEQAKGSEIAKK